MGSPSSPTMRYRRDKRRFQVHVGVFVIVNAFFIVQWLLVRDRPIEGVDPTDLACSGRSG